MFLDAFGSGMDIVRGEVCVNKQVLGYMAGNTFHSHTRFGTYFLNGNFPKNTDQSIANNGVNIDHDTCGDFTSSGSDNGVSVALANHFDYGNVFVGAYNLGDIQYLRHTAVDSNNLMYWKETKNFADGCSAHIKDSTYINGAMALPDHDTFIIENTSFERAHLEANHHCHVGVTGVLCMPTYILHDVVWKGGQYNDYPWVEWQDGGNVVGDQRHGGIFTISPSSTKSSFFPEGYKSVVSNKFSYLLNFDVGEQTCVAAPDLYRNSILCKVPLRALRIYSNGLSVSGTTPVIIVEVWNNGSNTNQSGPPTSTQSIKFHQVGSKQGFSVPVVPGEGHSYKISLQGGGLSSNGIPSDWVIEFSDPVVGNRWEADKLYLIVAGRSCESPVSSQHDRRFINMREPSESSHGHGACTNNPPMPAISCPQPLEPTSCADKCSNNCNDETQYCDCGKSVCVCKPGFIGETCEEDICAAARCGENGHCVSTFLGGTLAVNTAACVCDEGWSGPLCDQNPCGFVNCGAHGSCNVLDDQNTICICKDGYTGEFCDNTCEGKCNGNYPFGCSTGFDNIDYYYCGLNGGCNYISGVKDPPDGMCLYKENKNIFSCPACLGETDCRKGGLCVNQTCGPSINRLNGTPCNSIPGGICSNGMCAVP